MVRLSAPYLSPPRRYLALKTAREQLDIITAYAQLGSYRAAAALCGTTHKTVKRVVERQRSGELEYRGRGQPRRRNTDPVRELARRRVQQTDARISAKRLLVEARAAGYRGSDRNFRRVVAEAKANWRRTRRRYRPWFPQPGEHLVIDWGQEGELHLFCAVLAWSRYRFVRFTTDERRETTLHLLAECFEELGGVPQVVLSDRMACLRAGVCANVVVPHPDYVRFAAHFGFRPDFCETGDPESKGVVEHLVGYAKRDLVVPAGGWPTTAEANREARAWCAEVNARLHSEIAAIPAERLRPERELLRPLPSLRPPLSRGERRKVDKLATIRFGSARYSVPHRYVGASVDVLVRDGEVVITRDGEELARHPLVAPGEASIRDEHYGGPRHRPTRAVRSRSEAERRFLALGPEAEAFLRAAAAAGTTRLASELAAIGELEAAWGRDPLTRALERATTFRRFRAADVRAILHAGAGVPEQARPGEQLALPHLPPVATRSLAAYALKGGPR